MKGKKYPKVLIVGHYPGDYTGTTITLKNLFSDWPKEKLAVACNDSFGKMFSEYCSYYYVLGKKEITLGKLQKSLYKPGESQSFNEIDYQRKFDINKKLSKKKKGVIKSVIFEKIIKPVFIKSGLYFDRFNYEISNEFNIWIENFNPDIILTMLGDISTMKLAIDIKQLTKRKLAIYILDDWVNANPYYSWIPWFWKMKFKELFANVVELSDIQLAICDKMAEEYQETYGKKFHPFHNPSESEEYSKIQHFKENKNETKFVITYFGKINKDTYQGLEDMIQAIKLIENNEIHFNIYSGANNKKKGQISTGGNVSILSQVGHNKIPEILVKSDLIFIPLSFEKKSRRYTRLSMPTKISESMFSKTPILVYAPKEIALVNYVELHNCAFTVTKRSVSLLKEKVKDVMSNKKEVSIKVNNAWFRALNFHSGSIVRQKFLEVLK